MLHQLSLGDETTSTAFVLTFTCSRAYNMYLRSLVANARRWFKHRHLYSLRLKLGYFHSATQLVQYLVTFYFNFAHFMLICDSYVRKHLYLSNATWVANEFVRAVLFSFRTLIFLKMYDFWTVLLIISAAISQRTWLLICAIHLTLCNRHYSMCFGGGIIHVDSQLPKTIALSIPHSLVDY